MKAASRMLYSLKEVRQGSFPADGIADQQREKIDGFIAPKASSSQANLLRKSLERPLGRLPHLTSAFATGFHSTHCQE